MIFNLIKCDIDFIKKERNIIGILIKVLGIGFLYMLLIGITILCSQDYITLVKYQIFFVFNILVYSHIRYRKTVFDKLKDDVILHVFPHKFKKYYVYLTTKYFIRIVFPICVYIFIVNTKFVINALDYKLMILVLAIVLIMLNVIISELYFIDSKILKSIYLVMIFLFGAIIYFITSTKLLINIFEGIYDLINTNDIEIVKVRCSKIILFVISSCSVASIGMAKLLVCNVKMSKLYSIRVKKEKEQVSQVILNSLVQATSILIPRRLKILNEINIREYYRCSKMKLYFFLVNNIALLIVAIYFLGIMEHDMETKIVFLRIIHTMIIVHLLAYTFLSGKINILEISRDKEILNMCSIKISEKDLFFSKILFFERLLIPLYGCSYVMICAILEVWFYVDARFILLYFTSWINVLLFVRAIAMHIIIKANKLSDWSFLIFSIGLLLGSIIIDKNNDLTISDFIVNNFKLSFFLSIVNLCFLLLLYLNTKEEIDS